ncbi:hypothetical protein [Prevotella histicola]|jgi:hypothetical protein|uniref:hypothetical protein n=1 Tax=Prevotella histicola TaxID=470565 RepID=UPI0028EE392E|nr:hypothetical protein [Prevotella histicola]
MDIKKTKICAIDLEDDILSFLKKDFEVFEGTMGAKIDTSQRINRYDSVKLLPNYDFPANIQEYDILIQDMGYQKVIPYSEEEHVKKYITGTDIFYLYSVYPETLFNPIPYSSKLLNIELQKHRERPLIKIIFQGKIYSVTYKKYNAGENYTTGGGCFTNYEHIQNYCGKTSLSGRDVIPCKNTFTQAIFGNTTVGYSYQQIYCHPTTWENSVRKNEHFIPLLTTRAGDIISYFYMDKYDITIMLPQSENKLELLKNVFNELLYIKFSEYFPFIEAAAWKNTPMYFLPNQQELLDKEKQLTKKYQEDLSKIELQKEANSKQYTFLHSLLTDTGDNLVKAVIDFLQWLGFSNIVDADTTKKEEDIREEDIQVDLGDAGLLIIEVKGINGTSTDAQCSQIHKIKFRRCEERRAFDVYALYIVNNERNIEPLKRTRPPFKDVQIKDAQKDKRGLAYTWQLFNLFFDIENGFISKAEARESLINAYGLVDFPPTNLRRLGEPYNYYKKNTVICIEIKNLIIKVGDHFAYRQNDRWHKTRIVSIEENGQVIDDTSNGRYGFEVEKAIPNNVCLYLIQKPK